MRIRLALIALLAALVCSGCQSGDLVKQEVDSQRQSVDRRIDRAKRIADDPIGEGKKAADQRIADELRRRGVDGNAP